MSELKMCSNCSYWADDMDGDDHGTCSRYPYEMLKHRDEWCGEWTEENVRRRFDYDYDDDDINVWGWG